MTNYGHIKHADSHPVAFARAREKAKADGLRGAFGRAKQLAFIARSQVAALIAREVPPRPETPVNPWILKLRAKREKARAIKAAEEAKTLADSILPA